MNGHPDAFLAQFCDFGSFEWDPEKEKLNVVNHGLSFSDAMDAFLDSQRVIAVDEAHSEEEPRFFCIGIVGKKVATVRFTMRARTVRIIGAGYWRKGKVAYEKARKSK